MLRRPSITSWALLWLALTGLACTRLGPVTGSAPESVTTVAATTAGEAPTTVPTVTTSTALSPPTSPTESVTVTRVIDGDTIEGRMADGSTDTIRLIGINAPESGECYADRATQTLATMIPRGVEVTTTSDVSDRDQYGRLLRYLWVEQTLINEEMVKEGAALARRYPPDTALADRLESAEQVARSAGAGLWGPDVCGEASGASLVIVDIDYDAPGNDNDNLNEEWIEIRNDGDATVDLTGWMIRDESSTNRYAFPAGFALAAGVSVVIRTGCGVDTDTDLYWCSQGSAVWNNDGDTAFLLDPNGNVLVTFGY